MQLADPAHLQELLTCETRVWEALRTGDTAADHAALHPAFLGVYPDGMADKAAHSGQLADGPTIAEYTLSKATARVLAPDLSLLSYRADYARRRLMEPEAMYVTSIWERSRTGWVNVFSQDTPARA
ncbi:DUF4440 domain-containing protein [Roseobacteraceae bacterium S113]